MNELASIIGDSPAFVVGEYTDEGKPLKRGKFAGDVEQKSEVTRRYEEAMLSHGGQKRELPEVKPVIKSAKPVKAKPAKPVKTKPAKKQREDEVPEVETVSEEPGIKREAPISEPRIEVEFKTNVGTIKAVASAVLENDIGLALIFKSVDAVTFIPNKGDELALRFQGRNIEVMYLGILFDLPNAQKMMVFVTQ